MVGLYMHLWARTREYEHTVCLIQLSSKGNFGISNLFFKDLLQPSYK